MDAELYRLHADVEERHWWFTARRSIIGALLREVVPPGSANLVIDVGCGTGANAAALAGDYHVIGIDPEPAAIAFARQRFPRVRFVEGSSPADLPQAVDAAAFLFTDVLEHIEHDRAFLHEWLAVARPGAHFLITVPAEPALWSSHDEVFGHFRRYMPDTLSALWHNAPVKLKLLSAYNARLYPAIKLVRTISRAIGRTAGRAGSDLGRPLPLVNTMLHSIFQGEADRLKKALRGGPTYRRGVSLIALLERA